MVYQHDVLVQVVFGCTLVQVVQYLRGRPEGSGPLRVGLERQRVQHGFDVTCRTRVSIGEPAAAYEHVPPAETTHAQHSTYTHTAFTGACMRYY